MQKQEFEQLVKRSISDEDYKIIETVYQFHPAVSETSGKEEVAELYKSFGMIIFYDMFPRAEKNCELENKFRHAQVEAEQIKEQMCKLKTAKSVPKDSFQLFTIPRIPALAKGDTLIGHTLSGESISVKSEE